MVIAAASDNRSDDVMKFASNLTIDNEEYAEFGEGQSSKAAPSVNKLAVHATTQDTATAANFEAAAQRNSFDTLALFGMNMEKGKPGQ